LRDLSPPHEEVTTLLELFRIGDGQVLLDEPDFETDPRVSLRVTLLTGRILESVGQHPAGALEELHWLRDDLSSALEFFGNVQAVELSLLGRTSTSWHWQDVLTWETLCAESRDGLAVLQAPATGLPQRYGALVRLIRLQLFIWAQTFALEVTREERR